MPERKGESGVLFFSDMWLGSLVIWDAVFSASLQIYKIPGNCYSRSYVFAERNTDSQFKEKAYLRNANRPLS